MHIKIKGNSFASSLALQSTRNRIMQNGEKFLNNLDSNKSHITKKNGYYRTTLTAFYINARSIEL